MAPAIGPERFVDFQTIMTVEQPVLVMMDAARFVDHLAGSFAED